MTAFALRPFILRVSAPFAVGRELLERYGAPAVDLVVRLWMARVFFSAGLTKIRDWESTRYLFAEEYKLPLLPSDVAAVLGTATELTMPLLLALGLCTRLAAIPLLVMAAVIQFVLGASNPDYDHVEHIYWMLLLLVILVRGPGLLSVDAVLARSFR
jgi:putative oxidoreductase